MNDTDFKCLLNREAERFQDAYYEDWKNGRTVFQQVFMNESNPKMNDTLDYKISVMQAAREGEKIEHRNTKRARGGETEWFETSNPQWDWWNCDYRVKAQEPRRAFISTGDYDAYFFAYNPKTEIHKIESIQSETPKRLVEFIELTPEIKQKLGL